MFFLHVSYRVTRLLIESCLNLLFMTCLFIIRVDEYRKKPVIDKAREHELLPLRVLNHVTSRLRFCRAVTELQITGLLRMPSKRRPDYVQRVAFGL